ncbi:MAG: sulfatase-like hydrolase/transferase [Planctomycetes bacterium]|nr:sulfatase-like hydrolase/transferase [Planctomycetota bacterium]
MVKILRVLIAVVCAAALPQQDAGAQPQQEAGVLPQHEADAPVAENRPNIIFILADDLGYGDVQVNQPKSKIQTPNLNRLASEGMRFSDAHSGSAVCTPTRYGVITGRYCWRSSLKRGVLGGYSSHLIEPERPTVASVLKGAGYQTACIGKWHLGMDLPRKKGVMDWSAPIQNGPLANGFDYFWGVTASLDFPPYVWVENDRFTAPADQEFAGGKFPGYLRPGEIADGFVHEQALDQITEKAVTYLRQQQTSADPFFLYLPLTAPHKPVLPAERFRGRSGLGPYGDFVMQTDWVIGEVDRTLRECGLFKNTLVVVSSDNGSFMYRLNSEESPQQAKTSADGDLIDHVSDASVQGFLGWNHRANGPLRGTKADVWDGGHRVPFLVRWPGTIRAQTLCEQTVSLVDLMATFADVAGVQIPDGAAEDSFSMTPLWEQQGAAMSRPPVVQHSANGMFAIRNGKWKLILGKGSGGRGKLIEPEPEPSLQLYDMQADLGESNNLAEAQPGIVAKLSRQLEQIQNQQDVNADRPNIVLILADDLGWSDVGCYGSEIATPNIDALAADGIRFTQFYNTAKCFPSRASLLTGLYAQQVGMAKTSNAKLKNAATLAEVLRGSGYRTYMSGKFHGLDNPFDRGFDRYSGLRDGAANYFNPGLAKEGQPTPAQKRPGKRVWCFDDEVLQPYTPEDPNFYSTDAYTDWAMGFLEENKTSAQPFFLYLAYQAPHDPLQAWPEDIAKYRQQYTEGYEAVAAARFKRQQDLGLLGDHYQRSQPSHRTWSELSEAEREDQALRMAVYAAMVDRMDQNIGRLMSKINQIGQSENTVVIFASDNGASAEVVQIGNGPIGSMSRWSSLGKDWANVCNTPFRNFKNYSHEGGINTPFIVNWPAKLSGSTTNQSVGHFIDLMPTLLELAEAEYPEQHSSGDVLPFEGQSLLAAISGDELERRKPLFWHWSKGKGVRSGKWKLVSWGGAWELYDMEADPVENNNLAQQHVDKVQELSQWFHAWLQHVRRQSSD